MASSRGEGLFFSKLGLNLSEMEVKTFTRIKKVIWDQLLATKAKRSNIFIQHRAGRTRLTV